MARKARRRVNHRQTCLVDLFPTVRARLLESQSPSTQKGRPRNVVDYRVQSRKEKPYRRFSEKQRGVTALVGKIATTDDHHLMGSRR
jgi:hypothetical protein